MKLKNEAITLIKGVPINVEKHTKTHSAIEDVAVVGWPHDIDGERQLAFVVLTVSGQKTTANELITYNNG